MMKTEPILLLRFGLALLIWFNGSQFAVSAQSQKALGQNEVEHNKALVRRWIEDGFNHRNLKVVDHIFVETLEINGVVVSRENLKQGMRRRFAAFPDLQVRIEVLIGEGEKVGIWYTAQGTHKGEFEGIPATGRQVSWFGFDLLQVEGGKIARCWFVDDSLGLMQQLGVRLSPPSTQK